MSKILYEVYQNDIKDSESVMYGKWYARLKSIETMSTGKLAKHISEHGSVYTADVVEGVMKKFKTCLLEMLLESKKVKIAGLGTFYLTCECQKGGADKESEFNVAQHLKALHIRFLPDQTEEDNLSSREFIKKAEFVNVKSLLSGKTDEEGGDDEENGGSSNGGSSENGSGTQNGENSGSGTGSVTPSAPKLTISRSGNGTSSVSANGNAVSSGSELEAGTEVSISVTPAQGTVPTATLNGSNVALTENNGVYTGSFQMPSSNATLAINSGSIGGSDGGDMN